MPPLLLKWVRGRQPPRHPAAGRGRGSGADDTCGGPGAVRCWWRWSRARMSGPQPQAEPQLSSCLHHPPPTPSPWPPLPRQATCPSLGSALRTLQRAHRGSGLPCRCLGPQPDKQASAQDPMSGPTPRAPGNVVPTFPLTREPTWARALLGFLQRLLTGDPGLAWPVVAGGAGSPGWLELQTEPGIPWSPDPDLQGSYVDPRQCCIPTTTRSFMCP